MAHDVLPTVKCSSCCQPVPLADLGDHVCPPPNSHNLQKQPATTLLPQRLQSLVTTRSSPERFFADGERVLAPSRDPFQRLSPDQSHITAPKTTLPKNPSPSFDPPPPAPASTPPPDRIAFPVRDGIPPALQRSRVPSNPNRIPIQFSEPTSHPAPRRPSPLSGRDTPQPLIPPFIDRASPSSTGIHPHPSLDPTRTPSTVSTRPPLDKSQPLIPPFTDRASASIHPRPSFERTRTPSTVSTRPLLDKSQPLIPPFTDRASPSSTGIHPRPSFERTRNPSTVSTRPPLDKSQPPLRNSVDARRAVVDSHVPTDHKPSAPPSIPFALPLKVTVPPPAPGTVPFPSSAPVPPPHVSVRQPPPPPLSLSHSRVRILDREIDTKTGGAAGMAGVGRRGFQAAARAAMAATTRAPTHTSALGGPNGRRYLETNATVTPPPLSPNSVQTPSPVSPLPMSPVSYENSTHSHEQYPNLPSPHDVVLQRPPVLASNDKPPPLSFSPGVRIASPSRSPSPIPNPFERRVSGETITQSPIQDVEMPLPFFDILKPELHFGHESDDESVYTTHTDLKRDENAPSSPSADSDVGLAYAQDSDDDTPVVMPLDVRKSALKGYIHKVKFPTSGSSDGGGPSRQTSAASLRSALSSRSVAMSLTNGFARTRSASSATQSTAKSTGALERAMETLIEEGASVSVLASGSVLASIGGPTSGRGSGKPSRSNTVPGPASPEQKAPKLPTRSHTNPSHPHIHCERAGLIGEVVRIRDRGSAKQKDRICARCSSNIDDGRWIQMDGGNVLCERCWKNMYLPKCRRCNLPIEKQAVSSRDGQLKGKYHKECFNCHTCQKPFPDKEFYVFDGKPFCAYHYHEANNSLCGASSCGQPIEGPCAVTHSGKRYHPEHLLCEFEDGCKERLEEYWEVDRQMLCERHAAFIGSHDNGWTRGNDPAGDTQTRGPLGTDEGRMMKRMTRFIDLGGGDDDPDIR